MSSDTWLSNQLQTRSSVLINTDGAQGAIGITNNAMISWTSSAMLTLQARGDNNAPGQISLGGTFQFPNGGLTVDTGYGAVTPGNVSITGKTLILKNDFWQQVQTSLPTLAVNDFQITSGLFIRALSGNGTTATPYQLTDIYGVQGMTTAASSNYALANNIDASGTAQWNSGAGFAPIQNFSGSLDGGGHAIDQLNIFRSADINVGLFGYTTGGTITSLALTNASILGLTNVGGIVGQMGDGGSTGGGVARSFVTGSVTGGSNVGGLVGFLAGNKNVGTSYSLATVQADSGAVGGLVGNQAGGTISYSYAAGPVNSSSGGGGLIGTRTGGNLVDAVWDVDATGRSTTAGSTTPGSVGARGVQSADMLKAETFATWSDKNVITSTGGDAAAWRIYPGHTAPLIRTFLTPLTLDDVQRNYNGLTQSAVPSTLSPANAALVFGAASARNVGIYTSDAWSTQYGYDIIGTGQLEIVPVALKLTATAVSQVYNGTTTVTAPGAFTLTSGQLQTGDTGFAGTAVFSNKNVEVNKRITASGVVVDDGNGGGNYKYTYIDCNCGTVTKAPLTLGASGEIVKTYDGTTSASGTVVSLPGQLQGTDTIRSGTFSFDNKNVGTGAERITLTAVDIRDGNTGGNYDVTYLKSEGTINPARLVLGSQNINKVYDGTTTVNSGGSVRVVEGQLYGADSRSGGSFVFTDRNAGTSDTKVRTSGVTINDGNNGQNYTVSYQDTSGTITPAALSIGSTAITKTYDSTTNVTSGGAVTFLQGTSLVGTDSYTGGTFEFVNANAGTNTSKVITSGVTINDGNNGANYNVTYRATPGTINPASLVVGSTPITKTYDGTTTVTSGGAVTLLEGTQLFGTDSYSGGRFAFNDRNAGTSDTKVNTSAVTVSDANGGRNYTVTYQDTPGTILKAAITLAAPAVVSKTYDGTTIGPSGGNAVIVAGTTYGSDSISGGNVIYANKNAGTGKEVSLSGAVIADGNNGQNYSVSYAKSYNGTIDKANLTVAPTGVDKVYDGTTSASVNFTSTKVVTDTQLSFSGAASFTSADAASSVPINVTGIRISGADAINYNLLNSTASTSAAITPRPVTVVVDGNGNVSVVGGLPGATAYGPNYSLSYSSNLALAADASYASSLPSKLAILNPYGCAVQAVGGIGGAQRNGGAGCSSSQSSESMAARLADSAGDSRQ